MIRALLLCLVLAACGHQPTPEAACEVYGQHRADMPALGMSALDEWVATLDSAMTGACFP